VNGTKAMVQVFEERRSFTPGLKVKFLGKGMELGVSIDMLGRVFDGSAARSTMDLPSPEKYST